MDIMFGGHQLGSIVTTIAITIPPYDMETHLPIIMVGELETVGIGIYLSDGGILIIHTDTMVIMVMDITDTMATMVVTMDTTIITMDIATIIEIETIPEQLTVMVIVERLRISQLEQVLQEVVV